jgi:thiosulfate/3-mercaptopyruvate sulfurtransferase
VIHTTKGSKGTKVDLGRTLSVFVCFVSFVVCVSSSEQYARPELLVSTAWVAAHAYDRNVRVVDMRTRGFFEGHIPGAVPLANDLIRIPDRPPLFLPTEEEFERLMMRLSISNSTRVVVYDDRGGIYAARLWFVLNAFGHTNVALLDGGWTKWITEGRPTTTAPTDVHAPVAGMFRAKLNLGLVATAADVLGAIGNPGVKIVDARTPAEIEGRDLRGIKRGGAVPSSVPVYWEDTLTLDQRTFKSRAEIEKLYLDRGVGANDEAIIYCQVGMRASHDAFTLALIGRTKFRVYYGSWEEWGNRADLPIKKEPVQGSRFRVPASR